MRVFKTEIHIPATFSMIIPCSDLQLKMVFEHKHLNPCSGDDGLLLGQTKNETVISEQMAG